MNEGKPSVLYLEVMGFILIWVQDQVSLSEMSIIFFDKIPSIWISIITSLNARRRNVDMSRNSSFSSPSINVSFSQNTPEKTCRDETFKENYQYNQKLMEKKEIIYY